MMFKRLPGWYGALIYRHNHPDPWSLVNVRTLGAQSLSNLVADKVVDNVAANKKNDRKLTQRCARYNCNTG